MPAAARRDEWINLGVFARLKLISLQAYDRIVGLLLEEVSVDGCITKAPGGGRGRDSPCWHPASTCWTSSARCPTTSPNAAGALPDPRP